jgi:uncharacterized membrane protein YbhN (UPF0104 family)
LIACAIRVLSCAGYTVLTPGLSLGHSLIAREASAAVSNVIPGPSGTAAQYVILRSWGVRTEQFIRATVSVGVVNNIIIFAGPGLFFLLWVLTGAPEAKNGAHAAVFGLIAIVVAVLTIVVFGAIAHSERLARRVGGAVQACVNPFRRMAGKDPVTTWPDRTVGLRAETLSQLRAHGLAVIGTVGGGYLLNAILLVGCMYACGLDRDQLPFSLGLLLYSVSRLCTVVAITPGGVGVVEIVYTAVFVAVLGEETRDAVLAAVLVYRAFTYLLPIISGACAYLIWRLLRRHELRAEAEEAAAAG